MLNKFKPTSDILKVSVPASKSILNRALILAALSRGTVKIHCGTFAEDTRAALNCLSALGIKTEILPDCILVHGCGGDIPVKNAQLNVMSAGTAARFFTVALAFCGGDYRITSSEQMQKRPMEVLNLLEACGVRLEFEKEKYHFPFRMISDGISAEALTIDTDLSTQYASGILLAAGARSAPLRLELTGKRTSGSYINITLKMLKDFGIRWERSGDMVTVFPQTAPPEEYTVEPDVSGACYFYSLALLFSTRVLVKSVKSDSVQGDIKFLRLLKDRGVTFTDTPEGLLADGRTVKEFEGFDEDMRDFSDQTLTAAAIAPFASTPTVLRNIGHIRMQECDRVNAVCENLTALGVSAISNGNNIYITPSPVKAGTVKTFRDHRVAMAFALTALKTGNVTIENPLCCKKTFENYFEIMQSLNQV